MTILFEEKRFLLTERWKNEGKIKMEAYAVLATGGKQVLVKVGDTVEIEKIEAEEGKEVAEITQHYQGTG